MFSYDSKAKKEVISSPPPSCPSSSRKFVQQKNKETPCSSAGLQRTTFFFFPSLPFSLWGRRTKTVFLSPYAFGNYSLVMNYSHFSFDEFFFCFENYLKIVFFIFRFWVLKVRYHQSKHRKLSSKIFGLTCAKSYTWSLNQGWWCICRAG